jgi:hypothetical protein
MYCALLLRLVDCMCHIQGILSSGNREVYPPNEQLNFRDLEQLFLYEVAVWPGHAMWPTQIRVYQQFGRVYQVEGHRKPEWHTETIRTRYIKGLRAT